MVDLEPVDEEDDESPAGAGRGASRLTGSAAAGGLLADWETALPAFLLVMPHE